MLTADHIQLPLTQQSLFRRCFMRASNRPHYESCPSVRPSVCPFCTSSYSKTKKVHKNQNWCERFPGQKYDNVQFQVSTVRVRVMTAKLYVDSRRPYNISALGRRIFPVFSGILYTSQKTGYSRRIEIVPNCHGRPATTRVQ